VICQKYPLLGLLVFLLTVCQQKPVITIPKVSEKIKQEESFFKITPTGKNKKFKFSNEFPIIISDFCTMIGADGKKRKMPHQGIDIHDLPGNP